MKSCIIFISFFYLWIFPMQAQEIDSWPGEDENAISAKEEIKSSDVLQEQERSMNPLYYRVEDFQSIEIIEDGKINIGLINSLDTQLWPASILIKNLSQLEVRSLDIKIMEIKKSTERDHKQWLVPFAMTVLFNESYFLNEWSVTQGTINVEGIMTFSTENPTKGFALLETQITKYSDATKIQKIERDWGIISNYNDQFLLGLISPLFNQYFSDPIKVNKFLKSISNRLLSNTIEKDPSLSSW